ncbi:MAG: hypothetical protein M1826_004929 [Phylliscum demangeonii]|nr:MAG: hypothetical protein M1826_004929 [Phylliscum demangeonii]
MASTVVMQLATAVARAVPDAMSCPDRSSRDDIAFNEDFTSGVLQYGARSDPRGDTYSPAAGHS